MKVKPQLFRLIANQSRVVASLDDQASLKKLAKCKPAFKLVLTKLLAFSDYRMD
jgi:hypothetical protein